MGRIAEQLSQAQYKLEEKTNSPFGTWPEKLRIKNQSAIEEESIIQEDNSDESEQQETWANSRSYDQSSRQKVKKSFHPEGRQQHGLW